MAEIKPTKPTPKMADVAKPVGAQATSRPIIVGHGAVIRDPMMAPASWDGPAKPKPQTAPPVQTVEVPVINDPVPPVVEEVETAVPAEPLPAETAVEAIAEVPAEPATAPAVAPDVVAAAEPVPTPEVTPPAQEPVKKTSGTPGVTLSHKMVTDPNAKDPMTGEPKPATSSKPSITLVGKKIQPLNGFEGDGKDSNTAPEAPDPEAASDEAKSDAAPVEKVGALSAERLQELKNGKEYKVSVSKGHGAQNSWVAIVLVIILLAIGAAVALDAGWVDLGINLPFDFIK